MKLENNYKNSINLAIRQKFVAKNEANDIKQAQTNAAAKAVDGSLLYPVDNKGKGSGASTLNGALLFPNHREKPLAISMDEVLESSVQMRQSDFSTSLGAKIGKALSNGAKATWTLVASSVSAIFGSIKSVLGSAFGATQNFLSKITGKDAKANALLSEQLPGDEALSFVSENEKEMAVSQTFDEIAGSGIVKTVKGDIAQAAKVKADNKLAAKVNDLNEVASPAIVDEVKANLFEQAKQKSLSKASSATVSTETVNELKDETVAASFATPVSVIG